MKTGTIKKVLIIFVVAVGISGISFAHAVNISLSLPTAGGTNPCADPASPSCNPGNYINGFYQFALLIGGLLAFGAIVFGGVKYMTSAGNPTAQHEGKEWIQSALLGVLLLAGAYLILNTVNPALTRLNLPGLTPVSQFNGFGGGSSGGHGASGGY